MTNIRKYVDSDEEAIPSKRARHRNDFLMTKGSPLKTLVVSASELACLVGLGSTLKQQLFKFEEVLDPSPPKDEVKSFSPSSPLGPFSVARKHLPQLGVSTEYAELLILAEKTKTQQAYQALEEEVKQKLIKKNRRLVSVMRMLTENYQTQSALRVAQNDLLEKGKLLNQKALDWLCKEAGFARNDLLKQQVERLLQMVEDLESLGFDVLRKGRMAYGREGEASCLDLWNKMYGGSDSDDALHAVNTTYTHEVLPGAVIRGRPDALTRAKEIVEIKFRTKGFSRTLRWSEYLQMQSYMSQHGSLRCMLLEGVKREELMLLERRWVLFDPVLWEEVLEGLAALRTFAHELGSHRLFSHAYHMLSRESRAALLRSHMPDKLLVRDTSGELEWPIQPRVPVALP